MNDLTPIVRRLALTGAFTFGGVNPARLEAWRAEWRISEEAVDEWLADPEPNINRERAFRIAAYIAGVEGSNE